MKGCKPLSDIEVSSTLGSFTGAHALRDSALFILGLFTGLRVTELLSFRIRDVMQHGDILHRTYVERRRVKGKTSGRDIPLHENARLALRVYLATRVGAKDDEYLFLSRKGENKPIDRKHAWRILKAAFKSVKVTGKTGTHSMRKTFASRVYVRSEKDIRKTQLALGHKDLESTASYLHVEDSEVDELFLCA